MTKKKLTHEELNTALMAVQDLMERLAGCQFFPLNNTAKVIWDEWKTPGGKFKGDSLTIGIREAEWTKSRRSMFNTLANYLKYKVDRTSGGYDIELEGVPIHIKIIKRSYSFFENPDIKFWGVTEFFMPNPISEYWKVRGLIK